MTVEVGLGVCGARRKKRKEDDNDATNDQLFVCVTRQSVCTEQRTVRVTRTY